MPKIIETENTRPVTPADLRTPQAAAVAGLVFAALLTAIFLLFRTAVPADPREPGAWLNSHVRQVEIALNLLPFAGIAFLWFIGVLRDRLGPREDRFFSTVFFGSGLLFLAMLFAVAAFTGGMLVAFSVQPLAAIDSFVFHFARATAYNIANIYMAKMAAVFMLTTSSLAIRTGMLPRWLAFMGFAFGLPLLFASYYLTWSFFVVPLWVALISGWILRDQLRAAR